MAFEMVYLALIMFVFGAVFGVHLTLCYVKRNESPTLEQLQAQRGGCGQTWKKWGIALGIVIPIFVAALLMALIIINK